MFKPLREALSRIFSAAPPPPAAPLREAAGANALEDDADWRRLSGDLDRDLSPIAQARMRAISVKLWDSDPLANRLIELPLAYLLAEGVRLVAPQPEGAAPDAKAEIEALQAVLNDHWRHPINQWDIKLPKRLREYSLFGEQAWPAFVNDIDGSVTLGYLDPEYIATVVMDPDNPEQPIGVVTTKRKGVARRYRVIINGPERLFTQCTQGIRATFTDGDIFYFRCNDLCNSARGRGDLRAMADYLDAYDQFVFGEVERYNFLRAFFWDVTLQGANQEMCDARAKSARPPRAGSVRFHNESETWNAQTPDIQAADTATGAELIRNHVLGGRTIPSHWYGGGGDVNRSTGESMGEPTFKVFSMRQREVKHMLEAVGTYVLRQHLAHQSGEPAEVDWNDPRTVVACSFPEMTARDTTKYAAALQQVVVGVQLAIQAKLMTRSTGIGLIATVAAQLGLEIDPEKELANAEAEARSDQEKTDFTGPGAADVAAAMAAQGAAGQGGAHA